MQPTLEDVVAAFRSKQKEEDEAVRAEKAKIEADREAYSQARFEVLQKLRNDVVAIFKRLQDNDIVSISPVQTCSSNTWSFRVFYRGANDIRFKVREDVANSPTTNELRVSVYKQNDVWFYAFEPSSYNHTSDRAEFLLRLCEKAGRMEAKEGFV